MIETFAALAEPSRFRIVELLRSGPRPVGEISVRLHLAQPQVSKHLRVLKSVHLVEVRPQAQQRVYALRAEPLRAMHEWLEGYRQLWAERLDQLDDLLSELQHPPAPEKETRRNGRRKQ